jgi:hypothetical protein
MMFLYKNGWIRASRSQELKDLILQLKSKTAFLALSNYFCQL